MLRAAGYSAEGGTLAQMLARTAGVVPEDVALSTSQLRELVRWVDRGGRIATGNPALLASLGVGRTPAKLISAVAMKSMVGVAVWLAPLTLRGLATAGVTPFATSTRNGGGSASEVLMGSRRLGTGEVVAFAIDPVEGGREGYELMPRAAALVGAELGAPIGPKLDGAEIFVDPGGLSKSVKASASSIAALVAKSGARVAEIAGWNYDFSDVRNDFDYATLIAALHSYGILAYAWLEPPFVTLAMFQKYPACREKTESGRDAVVGWRSLIALEDPTCLGIAEQSWRSMLTKYQWDGVNVAELYFEPISEGASSYTPFSKAALSLFGQDPATHAAAFAAFRTSLVTTLNQEVLAFLNTLPNAVRLGLELTVIDNTLDPAAGNAVGSNVAALATVASHQGASLVVEDPTSTWTSGPLRYDRLGPHVKGLMPPLDSLIDVNVVQRVGARPTEKMVGTELALALMSACSLLGRVAIYALGTMSDQDLSEVPGALGGSVAVTDTTVDSQWTVRVTSPSASDDRLTVDGISWPVAGDTALVPAGKHRLVWSRGSVAGPGLIAFTGQLGTASASRSAILFKYFSHPDGLVVVDQRPTSLWIDGSVTTLSTMSDPAGGYVIRVPAGTHQAVIGF